MFTANDSNVQGAIAATSFIALNFCNQVIALQNMIAARDEGARFPTAQETNLLCKLINCLEKMTRISARLQAPPPDQNKKRQPAMPGNSPFSMAAPAVNAFPFPDQNQGILYQEPSAPLGTTDDTNHHQTMPRPTLTPPAEPLPATQHDWSPQNPVVTRTDFERTKLLICYPTLQASRNSPEETFEFDGVERNLNWLQYNLFQWYLPEHERNFFHDEDAYHDTFNHSEVVEQMFAHYSASACSLQRNRNAGLSPVSA